MKLISWNVNGIRAAVKKGFLDYLDQEQPDILCLQETKAHSPGILDDELIHPDKYLSYWNCAQKKGYSGVVCYTKKKPVNIKTNFGDNFRYIGRLLIGDWVLGFLLIIHMYKNIYTVPVETVETFNNWFAFFIGIILVIKYLINQSIKGKKINK